MQLLALFDAELQRIILGWDSVAPPIRAAMIALFTAGASP